MSVSIHQLQLSRFRAFEQFSATFERSVVLVGPNNAGKSSVLAALRAAAQMLRTARRVPSTKILQLGDDSLYLYEFQTESVGLDEENLRWEFTDDETDITVRFSNGAELRAVWPPSERSNPYFYLRRPDGESIGDPREVRPSFPVIGVLPALAPIERHEGTLVRKHVIDNVAGRLASRHFRNQVNLLSAGAWGNHLTLAGFFDYCRRWLPEIEMVPPEVRDFGRELDLYYRDDLTHKWKELVWAGDGFQVFVQILFHLYRLQGSGVVVLDEPDAFLHPDLQRRLVGAVRDLDAQSIITTHSSEIIAEAGPESVVFMDRTRPHALRIRDDRVLEQLTSAIGTHFDLRLARVLRAKVVLFVEGQDMRLLKLLARTVGANAFATEHNMALVPIEGGSNWRRLEGFGWLADNWLKGTIRGWLVLDRDYHSEGAVVEIGARLSAAGLTTHVWSSKELESYLLVPSLLARQSGASPNWVLKELAEITEPMYEDVLLRLVQTFQEDNPDSRREQIPSIAAKFQGGLRATWLSVPDRLARCPAKTVLATLNGRLQEAGFGTPSVETLARNIRRHELADEVASLLGGIERALA